MLKNKRRVIGIIGHKGSGKTTVMGAFLHAYGFTQVHIADPVREMLVPFLRAHGFSESEITRMLVGDLKREPIAGFPSHVTPTYLQQTLGTEWGRALIDSDLWLKLWVRRSKRYPLVYNDSVRFPNEARLILDQGGWLIRITRASADSAQDMHPSEQHIPHLPYHFKLPNEGTREQFATIARPVLEAIMTLDPTSDVPLQNVKV